MITNDNDMAIYISKSLGTNIYSAGKTSSYVPDTFLWYMWALNNIGEASRETKYHDIPSKFWEVMQYNPIVKSMLYTSYRDVGGEWIPKSNHYIDVLNVIRVIIPSIHRILDSRGIGFKSNNLGPIRYLKFTKLIESENSDPCALVGNWCDMGFMTEIKNIIENWDRYLGTDMLKIWNRYLVRDKTVIISKHMDDLSDVFFGA